MGGHGLGKSDRFAAYPAAHPVAHADVVATIHYVLGVDGGIVAAESADQPVKL